MNNCVFFLALVIFVAILWGGVYFYKPTSTEDINNKNLNQRLFQQQRKQLTKQQHKQLMNETAYRFMQEQSSNAHEPLVYAKKSAYLLTLILSLLIGGYYWSTQRLPPLFKQSPLPQRHNVQVENAAEKMIIAIQHKLRQDVDNGENWYELGLAYAQNNEFDHALEAYSRATILLGRQPYLLGAAATALYYKHQQTITAQAQQWLDEALQSDPAETAALLLLANDAFNRQQYQRAIQLWQQVLDSQRKIDRKLLIQMINIATEKSKIQP